MHIKWQNSLKICQQSGIINVKCIFCPKLPRFTLLKFTDMMEYYILFIHLIIYV